MVALGLETFHLHISDHFTGWTHVFSYLSQLGRWKNSTVIILVHNPEYLLLLTRLFHLRFTQRSQALLVC